MTVTIPSDSINIIKNKNLSDLSPDANAKAGKGDNPNLPKKNSKVLPTMNEVIDKAGGRIGKDPTEVY